MNILLSLALLFVAVLYHKYLYTKPDVITKPAPLKGPSVCGTLCCVIAFPIVWILSAPFICNPLVSIILLALLQGVGCYIVKRKWVVLCHLHDRYNRSLVLKHFAIFVIYTLVLCSMISVWGKLMPALGYDEMQVEYWNETVAALGSHTFFYSFTLAFFTVNSIFGPILTGLIYLKRYEIKAIRKIQECQQEISSEISDLIKQYESLISDLDD